MAVEEYAADKDVEGAAADEGEEERGVAGDLGRDLELEEAGGCFRCACAAPRPFCQLGGCFLGNGDGRAGQGENVPAPKIMT